MKLTERPLTCSEAEEFRFYSEQGLKDLGVTDPRVSPDSIIALIDSFVDKWQEEGPNKIKRVFEIEHDLIDVALGLGAAWGDQVIRQFGWVWLCIVQADNEWYGVVSPHRSLAIYPAYFIKACLTDPRIDCTAALSFNMLKAGNVPNLCPNGYEDFVAGVHRIVPKR
jgi:hypothetical protein